MYGVGNRCNGPKSFDGNGYSITVLFLFLLRKEKTKGCWIGFSSAAIVNVIKYSIAKKDSDDRQILILSLFVAMLLEFFVEPIPMGNPYFYMCFCFITGGIVAQNRNVIRRLERQIR